jgi:hypothetical protein
MWFVPNLRQKINSELKWRLAAVQRGTLLENHANEEAS